MVGQFYAVGNYGVSEIAVKYMKGSTPTDTLQAYVGGGLPPQGWPFMGTWSGYVPLFLT